MTERPSKKAEKLFAEEVRSNPERCLEDFSAFTNALEHSTARYLGEVVDTYYEPMFFDSEDVKECTYIAWMLDGIVRKVSAAYIDHDEVRELFGFSPPAEELILIDPGYSHPAPMTRADVFYSRNSASPFCEFNTDGTSGMNETNELDRLFLQTGIAEALRKISTLSNWELIDSWADCLLEIYREFGGPKAPAAAITDWDGVGVRAEFTAIQRALERRGVECRICDPREFSYSGGGLRLHGRDIDLVYRRAVNFECFERAEEIDPLISAVRDGAVCMVGPFRSQIIHNKMIFPVLRHPEITALFSEEEREFLRTRLPETRNLLEDEDLIESAAKRRETLVLKPADKYAADEVYIGRDTSRDEWTRLLRQKSTEGGYLLQDFIVSEARTLYTPENGGFVPKICRNVLGVFMYSGKFTGLYPRVSSESIIASLWKCRSLAAIYVSGM